jgi:hypothetical protein
MSRRCFKADDLGSCSGTVRHCAEIGFGSVFDDDYDEVVLWACDAHAHLLPDRDKNSGDEEQLGSSSTVPE